MQTQQRFFQRGILRFETKLDESGIAVIAAAHLTCGHRVAYKRRQPAPSKRSTMPCPQCGSGLRIPWEKARADMAMERVIERAARDETCRRELAALLRIVIEIGATCPLTELQRKLWDRLETQARASGLRDRDQGVIHERGSRTLTREQRDALLAIGGA